jgi:hypothetical protein
MGQKESSSQSELRINDCVACYETYKRVGFTNVVDEVKCRRGFTSDLQTANDWLDAKQPQGISFRYTDGTKVYHGRCAFVVPADTTVLEVDKKVRKELNLSANVTVCIHDEQFCVKN